MTAPTNHRKSTAASSGPIVDRMRKNNALVFVLSLLASQTAWNAAWSFGQHPSWATVQPLIVAIAIAALQLMPSRGPRPR